MLLRAFLVFMESQIKLTPKQEAFAAKYVECGNATEAYRTAYKKSRKWKETSLNVQAIKSLHNPKISKRIVELRGATSEELLVSPVSVLREYARNGFSDIRKLFEKDGSLKHIHDLDDDIAAAVSSIEVVTKSVGHGEVEYVAKVKLWPKNPALESLGKNLGLFEKHQIQKAKEETTIVVEFI